MDEIELKEKVWMMFCLLRDPKPTKEWKQAYELLADELVEFWVVEEQKRCLP